MFQNGTRDFLFAELSSPSSQLIKDVNERKSQWRERLSRKQSELWIVTVMDDVMFIDFFNLYCCLISSGKRLASGSHSDIFFWNTFCNLNESHPKHWKHQSVIGLGQDSEHKFCHSAFQPSSILLLLGRNSFLMVPIQLTFIAASFGRTFFQDLEKSFSSFVALGASKSFRVFDCKV